MKTLTTLLMLTFTSLLYATSGDARLLRFPTVHGKQVVFTYGGDLYTVSIDGGIARKLTSDVGYEMFARFSPDGKTLAFTGQYDGNTEVFTIPSEGGVPKRITTTATLNRDDVADRMGPNNIVMTWTSDGKNIVYRSRKQSFNSFVGNLFMVPAEGGMSIEIPLSGGGFCSYSPNGKKLAFNNVFREFRTWKYYKGGMADDIRIFDLETKEIANITNNPAQDIFPMWIGNEIYFLSDRDRTMNLFVYNTHTKVTEKVTNFTDYDIKFPSFDQQTIVFEKGGYIYAFDVKSRHIKKIEITITDDQIYARNQWVDASKRITNMDLSPDGERVVFSARGDIFTLPKESGITRNLTKTSNAHEREGFWSPDGKWIAYLSDQTGEYEIYIQAHDGKTPPQQITLNNATYLYSIQWAPDSKKILFNNRKGELLYVDIETKKATLVATGRYSLIYSYTWSPDGQWISYSTNDSNRFSVVYVYNLNTKATTRLTESWYNSYSPVFSTDGKYLLFVSGRDFNPIYSHTEWNHAYVDMNRIYMILLSKETPSPFAPENNEPTLQEETQSAAKSDNKSSDPKNKKTTSTTTIVKIDFDQINQRIVAIPTQPGNYYNIYCVDNKIYYNFNKSNNYKSKACVYDLKKQKETELGEGLNFVISSNNKKMLVSKDRQYSVIDLPTAKINLENFIDLSNMKVWIDYQQEWKQIFDESWRQMRDFFYVANMHGVDWKAIHEKYSQLLPYVSHRNDLTYIVGEMIGELNVGHAYVNSGDRPEPKRIQTGLLGAKISKDPTTGYFRIDKILEGTNWSTSLYSPLLVPGVNASEGNFIIAVDGIDLKSIPDIYTTLIDKANKTVELTINTKPDPTGSRKVLIKTIDDESALYYYNWVQSNIRKVSEATNGQVGYIHIPDMGVAGLNEFSKYFYPQLTKKALIIDDRGNGGGNVSPMILERLGRTVYRLNMWRGFNAPTTIPAQTHYGPKVALINQYSASDGDLFPYGFRQLNLGPIIGVRSWGGIVGISGSLPFVDGADLRVPQFTSYSVETGDWIIEGHGVDPDIVIENDPYKEYMGEDAQLNKAIEVILEKMKSVKPLPPVPADPDRSK